MSPTARTMKLFRSLGYLVANAERWNPHTRTRHDLFGFADLVVFRTRTAYVQVCAASSMSARCKKVNDNMNAQHIARHGEPIYVVAWGKRGARGKRKTWHPTIRRMACDAAGTYVEIPAQDMI